mmetsp:Transcript_68761/g.129761  ORF Transcript_68761/g.129761 Transcript_68761/m.129761 type:complete len:125 (+) Transcript_68761:50-424(+)
MIQRPIFCDKAALAEDPEFWREAILQDWHTLRLAPESIRADRELILEVMPRSHGMALKDAGDSLRTDRSFVLEAINHSDGEALSYALDEFRADHKLMLRSTQLKQRRASAAAPKPSPKKRQGRS